MSAPGSDSDEEEIDAERSTSRTPAPHRPWSALTQSIAAESAARLTRVERVMEGAIAAGGRPFEVIVGAPARRYGVRLTFAPERPLHGEAEVRGKTRLAEAFGLHQHPWGAPSWVGARIDEEGSLRVKAYHRASRLSRLEDYFRLPPGLPRDMEPLMASLDGPDSELYFTWSRAGPWGEFAAACATLVGRDTREVSFLPRPRPTARSFGASLRWRADTLVAVTLYADWRTLPPDDVVARAWQSGLEAADVLRYERALAGVRSLGRVSLRPFHTMLAWTFEEGGVDHRAASLRVPAIRRVPLRAPRA